MDSESLESFERVNERLKEIIKLVGDDSIPLDQALELFEEAAMLGVRASDMLEQNVIAKNEDDIQAPVD